MMRLFYLCVIAVMLGQINRVSAQELYEAEKVDYFEAKKFDMPYKEEAIIITDHGFIPDKITLFGKERIKFFITTTTNKPSCFFIPDKNIFISAEKGKVTEVEASFDRPGDYQFHCPNGNLKGKITIFNNKAEQYLKIKGERSPASLKEAWMPKDD